MASSIANNQMLFLYSFVLVLEIQIMSAPETSSISSACICLLLGRCVEEQKNRGVHSNDLGGRETILKEKAFPSWKEQICLEKMECREKLPSFC